MEGIHELMWDFLIASTPLARTIPTLDSLEQALCVLQISIVQPFSHAHKSGLSDITEYKVLC